MMIQLSATEALLVGSGFTIIGALIGALATVFAARLAAERQHIYENSAKFRAEFVDEIRKLRTANEDVFRIINDETMDRHCRAKTIFEPWVACSRLKAFEKSWEDYECSIKTKAPGSLDSRVSECESTLSDIDRLLSFATHRG